MSERAHDAVGSDRVEPVAAAERDAALVLVAAVGIVLGGGALLWMLFTRAPPVGQVLIWMMAGVIVGSAPARITFHRTGSARVSTGVYIGCVIATMVVCAVLTSSS